MSNEIIYGLVSGIVTASFVLLVIKHERTAANKKNELFGETLQQLTDTYVQGLLDSEVKYFPTSTDFPKSLEQDAIDFRESHRMIVKTFFTMYK